MRLHTPTGRIGLKNEFCLFTIFTSIGLLPSYYLNNIIKIYLVPFGNMWIDVNIMTMAVNRLKKDQ